MFHIYEFISSVTLFGQEHFKLILFSFKIAAVRPSLFLVLRWALQFGHSQFIDWELQFFRVILVSKCVISFVFRVVSYFLTVVLNVLLRSSIWVLLFLFEAVTSKENRLVFLNCKKGAGPEENR